jgi:ankyrin repeat protein
LREGDYYYCYDIRGLYTWIDSGHQINPKTNEYFSYANIEKIYKKGDKSLVYAVKHNDLDSVKQLILNHTANRNNLETYVIREAAELGFNPIVKYLIAIGVDINDTYNNPLSLAIMKKHMNVFNTLVAAGADVNIRLPHENHGTPLYFAISFNNVAALRLLLQKGANPNVNLTGEHHSTPLSYACGLGKLIPARILIENGANVNARYNDSVTALYVAAYNGRDEIVKLLLDNGALINHYLDNGTTALFVAVARNHLRTVKVLIQYGADVNMTTNRDDATPLMIASKNNNYEIARVLLEANADLNMRTRKNKKTALDLTRDPQMRALLQSFVPRERSRSRSRSPR